MSVIKEKSKMSPTFPTSVIEMLLMTSIKIGSMRGRAGLIGIQFLDGYFGMLSRNSL